MMMKRQSASENSQDLTRNTALDIETGQAVNETADNAHHNKRNSSDESYLDEEDVAATNNSNDNDDNQKQRRPSHQGSLNSNNSNNNNILLSRKNFITALILLIGSAGSIAFLVVAATGAETTQETLFAQRATEISHAIHQAWENYELFGLWTHDACTGSALDANHDGNSFNNNLTISQPYKVCSHERFRQSYEYIQSWGASFQAIQLLINITNEERPAYEEESKKYYQENYHDTVNYIGLKGFVTNNETGGLECVPMWEEPFYFALHHLAPVTGNEAAIDLNIYSHPKNRHMIDSAVSTWKPALSTRGRLVQETEDHAYGVILMHPGYPASTRLQDKPYALAQVVVRIPDLLARASSRATVSLKVALYDSTDDSKEPEFLGGENIAVSSGSKNTAAAGSIERFPETSLTDLIQTSQRSELRELQIANRKWLVVVTPMDGTFQPSLVFFFLGGSCILLASILLAVWFHSSMGRMEKLNTLKAQAEAEKAAIIVKAARQQAIAEAQLNDFIAHEVRNPLSSAIAALSFLASSVGQKENTEAVQKSMREDVGIIDASLQFINELMKNLLDMRRASNRRIKIHFSPVDVKRDILQAVASILYLRGQKVQVQVDCADNLVVQSDKLHLKQIILNLSANAIKFVEKGYIRLRANISDHGSVQVFVEDSGPGIPFEKRSKLFAKFQDSLDILNQGTGIGLCLCKHLSDLMGCDISLDESFDSGIPDMAGTRFVVDLNVPAIQVNDEISSDENNHVHDDTTKDGEAATCAASSMSSSLVDSGNATTAAYPITKSESNKQLPDTLSILFVDDDLVLRKMFSRALKRVAPDWIVEEAANGETALHLVEDHKYDVIFLDQYMASVQKQLTGSETVRALRAKGVGCQICGSSANDVEAEFMDAGADSFMFKPFPCKKNELQQELLRILSTHRYGTQNEPEGRSLNGGGGESVSSTDTCSSNRTL